MYKRMYKPREINGTTTKQSNFHECLLLQKNTTAECSLDMHVAIELLLLVLPGVISAELKCQTQGCPRPKRKKDDGSGYFDYCSLTCRNEGQMPGSGMSSPTASFEKYCLYDCKFVVFACFAHSN